MSVVRRIDGLSQEVNPQLETEMGACSLAQNVVFRRRGMAEPRPGLLRYPANNSFGVPENVKWYQENLVLTNESATWIEGTAFGGSASELDDPNGDPVEGEDDYGSMIETRGNLYMGTQRGIQKISTPGDTVTQWSGVLPIARYSVATATPSAIGTYNWLGNNMFATYSVVVSRTDANGVIVLSAPSLPVIAGNVSGSSTFVNVAIRMHADMQEGDVLEIYRSVSSSVGFPEDKYLATTYTVTSADIGAGIKTIADQTDDTGLGRALYSNATQRGYAYDVPPRARALGLYAGSLFAGNIQSRQYLDVIPRTGTYAAAAVIGTIDTTSGSPIINVASASSRVDGATYVVGQIVTSANIPLGAQITNVAGPTVTLSANATATASGTSATFNDVIEITDGTTTELMPTELLGTSANQSVLVWAQQLSGYLSVASVLYPTRLRERHPGGGTLTVRATNGAALYDPPLPEFNATPEPFEQDRNPGLLMWSLIQAPEHFVPGLKQTFVGDPDKAIQALVAAKDRLYIFKTDGIWVLQGASERAGFRLDNLSRTHVLMSPRHAVEADGKVYAWTDQGVVRITTDNGIVNISDQRISNQLRRRDVGDTDGNIAYDALAKEIHLIAAASPDPADIPRLHLVYNTETDAWSSWRLKDPTATTLLATKSSRLGGGGASHAFGFIQRRLTGDQYLWQTPSAQDSLLLTAQERQMDLVFDVTGTLSLSSAEDRILIFSTPDTLPYALEVGDCVVVPAGLFPQQILPLYEVSSGTSGLCHGTTLLPTGAATALAVGYAFECRVRLRPMAEQDPGMWKHWDQVTFTLEGALSLWRVGMRVSGNTSASIGGDPQDQESTYDRSQDLLATPDGGALPVYGNGDEPRLLVQRDHAWATALQVELDIVEAGSIWAFSGVSLYSTPVGKKFRRG